MSQDEDLGIQFQTRLHAKGSSLVMTPRHPLHPLLGSDSKQKGAYLGHKASLASHMFLKHKSHTADQCLSCPDPANSAQIVSFSSRQTMNLLA